MATSVSSKPPESIRFIHEGDVVSPGEVFKILYGTLEAALPQKPRDFYPKRIGVETRGERHKALFHDWLRNTGSVEIVAEARFDDGTHERYSVTPRTDFDYMEFYKPPSVAFLQGASGNHAVLRESRSYSLEDVVRPMINGKAYGKDRDPARSNLSMRFDAASSDQFFRDGEKGVEPAMRKSFMYVPEPQLLAGLEELYGRGFPRITPHIWKLDHDDEKMWYIREFLDLAGDIRMGAREIGPYFGATSTLGLVEVLDGKLIHMAYVGEESNVGTFDPDLMLHCRDRMSVDQRTIADIKGMVKRERAKVGIPVMMPVEEYVELVVDRMRETQATLRGRGFDEYSLLEHLPRSIGAGNLPSMACDLPV